MLNTVLGFGFERTSGRRIGYSQCASALFMRCNAKSSPYRPRWSRCHTQLGTCLLGSEELGQEDRMLLRCNASLFAEGVVPELYHILTICHDAMLTLVFAFRLRGASINRTGCSTVHSYKRTLNNSLGACSEVAYRGPRKRIWRRGIEITIFWDKRTVAGSLQSRSQQ